MSNTPEFGQSVWDEFVINQGQPAASFLQSWQWGRFRQLLGERIYRLVVVRKGTSPQFDSNQSPFTQRLRDQRASEGKISVRCDQAGVTIVKVSVQDSLTEAKTTKAAADVLAVAQLVKRKLVTGKCFLDLGRGPIFNKLLITNNYLLNKACQALLINLKYIAERERAVFIRISLPDQNECISSSISRLFGSPASKPKILTKQKPPPATLLLDLSLPAEKLLGEMRPKTRYNIKLAERRGVIVNSFSGQKAEAQLNNFYKLLQATAARRKIGIYREDYYRQLLQTLKTNLYLASYQGELLAGAIVVFFGQTATYLHGASTLKEKRIMAPYLLHWQIIKQAQGSGYQWYDWWGIAREVEVAGQKLKAIKKTDPWFGLTRFKLGFASQKTARVIHYPPSFDFKFKPSWYGILSWAVSWRKRLSR